MLGERGRSLALPAAILAPSVAPATFFAIIKNSHGTCNGSYPALMGYISAPIEAAAGMLIFSILAFVPGVILAERAYSQYYGGIFQFYEDHVAWIRKDSTEELKYSDLHDAYFRDMLYRNALEHGKGTNELPRVTGSVSFRVNDRIIRHSAINSPSQ